MAKDGIDFLGIGAQRAGTSWLWVQLKKHPRIWMPPRKELHYFDRSEAYPSPSHLASSGLLPRFFGRSEHNKDYRKLFRKELQASLRRANWKEIRWTLSYYLGSTSDAWYRSLFKDGADKVKGEITPAYSILGPEEVNHVHRLFPALKIIFLLRNPIDRAWSQCRLRWTRRKFEGIKDVAKIEELIESPAQTLRSDYVRTIHIWRSIFSSEQLFIGFYDDIVQHPNKLLSDILNFLGLDSRGGEYFHDLKRRVNVAKAEDMPDEVRFYLARKYHRSLEELSQFLGSHASVWLKDSERILEAHQA